MRHTGADTYPSEIQFVPYWCKTQEMSDETIDTCFFVFNSVLDRYKIQEMCGKVW